jgi:hypothetical protein
VLSYHLTSVIMCYLRASIALTDGFLINNVSNSSLLLEKCQFGKEDALSIAHVHYIAHVL